MCIKMSNAQFSEYISMPLPKFIYSLRTNIEPPYVPYVYTNDERNVLA